MTKHQSIAVIIHPQAFLSYHTHCSCCKRAMNMPSNLRALFYSSCRPLRENKSILKCIIAACSYWLRKVCPLSAVIQTSLVPHKKGIQEQCYFKGVLIYQINLILSYNISILSRQNYIMHSLKYVKMCVQSSLIKYCKQQLCLKQLLTMINMGVFNQGERGRTSLIMGELTPSAWLWACSHWEVVSNMIQRACDPQPL